MNLEDEVQEIMPEVGVSELTTVYGFLHGQDGYDTVEQNLTAAGFYGDAEEVSEKGHSIREEVAETVQEMYGDLTTVAEVTQHVLEVDSMDGLTEEIDRALLTQMRNKSEHLQTEIENMFDPATYEEGAVPSTTYQIAD